MGGSETTADDQRARLDAWLHAGQAAVCDISWPWPHGTVLRASGHPSYYAYNLVRVEDDPGMTVAQLVAFADEALAGLAHRRIDFDYAEAADPLRPEFSARGWRSTRVVWMRHSGEPPLADGPELAIEEVPFDAVRHLRLAWHNEDYSGTDFDGYYAGARAVSLARGVRTFAVVEDGRPVAFTELDRRPRGAEIALVYVAAERRGSGLGTALTRATILAAGDVEDLWIGADDEDRPKQLYARLGFRPVGCSLEFTRWPAAASTAA